MSTNSEYYVVRLKRTIATQTNTSVVQEDRTGHAFETQKCKKTKWEEHQPSTSSSPGSYCRKEGNGQFMTYDNFKESVIPSKNVCIRWCMDNKIIASSRTCPKCHQNMVLITVADRSDGLVWKCRRQINKVRHQTEVSIRKDSFFEASNLTIEETLTFTYWWSTGMAQCDILKQMRLSSSTAVDWDMFCREFCEMIVLEKSEKLGGDGVEVQIDESKIGKRKYHRGHIVEGQWVFGGIEKDSRKCFIVAVEHRDAATLLPIIQHWIKPGSVIVSDCWRAYSQLEQLGYGHEWVNHSNEFKNDNGYTTNKIEGHWRQMKVNPPQFGRVKQHYDSYLGAFMYRYMHKDHDIFMTFINDLRKHYAFT